MWIILLFASSWGRGQFVSREQPCALAGMVHRPEEFRMLGYQVNYQEISNGGMKFNIRSLFDHQRYHELEAG